MNTLGALIENVDVIPKTINSDIDFLSINCPEHGLYYKSVKDIKKQDTSCPRCQFLKPSRMYQLLSTARCNLGPVQSEVKALYYRLHITHRETGFEFQKIGILVDEEFADVWDPFKWSNFKIEIIDLIEGNLSEVQELESMFRKENTGNKITVGNELGFNLNKTYLPDFIVQLKSKTIKTMRETLLSKQKGLCTVCGKPVRDPTLDHEHIKKVRGTGLIRSTVCSRCNTYIARIENNAARHGIKLRELPDVLRRMASHLEDQKDMIHPSEVPKRKKVGARDWNRVRKYYFDVFPGRRLLPKRPTYITDSWLEIKQAVDDHVENIKLKKKKRK